MFDPFAKILALGQRDKLDDKAVNESDIFQDLLFNNRSKNVERTGNLILISVYETDRKGPDKDLNSSEQKKSNGESQSLVHQVKCLDATFEPITNSRYRGIQNPFLLIKECWAIQ